jgi:hypothetical protein
VSPELAAALRAVVRRLDAAGVPLLLGGSALLHALGLDVAVRDLDLVARPQDRAAAEAAAGEWWVETTTAPTALFRSPWKARLGVGGAEVELLGGLAWTLADGGPAVTMPFRAEGAWRCGDVEIGLAPAAHWQLLYERYRPERAEQLARLVPAAARAAALEELTRSG